MRSYEDIVKGSVLRKGTEERSGGWMKLPLQGEGITSLFSNFDVGRLMEGG